MPAGLLDSQLATVEPPEGAVVGSSADYAKPGVMLSSACPVEGLAQQGFEIRLTLWSVSFA